MLPRLLLIAHRDSESRRDDARAIAREILAVNPDLTGAEANRMTLSLDAEDAFRRAGLP